MLEGVSVLVGPVDKDSWGDDEVRERRLGIKRAALEKAEAASKKEGKGHDDDQVSLPRAGATSAGVRGG